MATATPTVTEQYTTTVPAYARQYVERLLGEAEALSRRGYEPYEGQRLAGFNPLQQAAFGDLASMGVSPYTGQAAGLASLAGQRAGEMGYAPMGERQYFTSPDLQRYQMTAPERVGAERFGLGAMQEYMSPYMSGVVEQQKREAIQDYARQIPGLQAAGIRAGARGGTREALLQSEAQRNLQQQLGGIEAMGRQQAYQQAAQQFGADRAAAMQAAQLNQAAQLQAQQQGITQEQALNQLRAQVAGMGAQYGLGGAELAERSRQYGAGLGMQGLQNQLTAAGTLGGLGQQAYQQQLGIGQAQLGAGAQIQALEQQNLANQYQDWLNFQQQPFQQYTWFSDILRGVPSSTALAQRYQSAPSTLGLIGGIATAGIGGLFGGLGGGTGGVPTTSDRRLKSNVVRVGTHSLGIGIYEYDIWGLRQRGVMADEVMSVMPEAVVMQDNGYMAVRYDMIGGV